MLCALSGKESPSAADIKAVITASGAEVDEAKLTAYLAAVEGKSLDTLLEEGKAKMKTVSGSAGGGGGGGGGGAAAAEAEVAEEEEEEVDVGGGGLFGGDEGGGGY